MVRQPTIKKQVAVSTTYMDRIIMFYAHPDAVLDFEKYGKLMPWGDYKDGYWLVVDPRYDFNEVLEYMENYG